MAQHLSEIRGQAYRDSTTFAEAKGGRKNILINPNETVNQRNWDGNWSAVPQKVYGPDRWRRQTGTNKKEQPIVEGEYKPSTVYTLSGTGIATEQLTSPASGTWIIDVPFAATDLQLEEGDIVTPQEWRSFEAEKLLCYAYYQKTYNYPTAPASAVTFGATFLRTIVTTTDYITESLHVPMRDAPAITAYSPSTGAAGKYYNAAIGADRDLVISHTSDKRFRAALNDAGGVGNIGYFQWIADAEVHT